MTTMTTTVTSFTPKTKVKMEPISAIETENTSDDDGERTQKMLLK